IRLKDKPVYITENGISCNDDDFRIVWLVEYLSAVHECIQMGVDVKGYLYWSLLDNYEWGSYTPRFGLVDVDRANNFKRTVKPSGYFYKEIIENNGFKPEILKKYLQKMPRTIY
ncbi:MAG: family 1 glycosylhydrolase, partial [Clostridia bacterium]|nr:family 1 glycosylhydrolase [Clostridia bacterium]